MSFGRDLQQERQKCGVTLEAIAASTRIPARHLRALEEDSWNALPGGVFTRGMVRNYCEFLGLNQADWLQRLTGCLPSASVSTEDLVEFAQNVKRTRVSTQPQVRRRWVGVLVMLMALAALSWAAWQYVLVPRVQPGQLPSVRALMFPPKH